MGGSYKSIFGRNLPDQTLKTGALYYTQIYFSEALKWLRYNEFTVFVMLGSNIINTNH